VNRFSADITATLREPLDTSHVKQRQGRGGKSFSYLPAFYVKQSLNRVFGEGGWDHEVKNLNLLQDGQGRVIIVYCVVSLIAHEAQHDGVGCGTPYGQDADSLETAIKGAESDALKRAASNFGDQFGLCLYEGDQPTPATERPAARPAARGTKPPARPSAPARPNPPVENPPHPESEPASGPFQCTATKPDGEVCATVLAEFQTTTGQTWTVPYQVQRATEEGYGPLCRQHLKEVLQKKAAR